MGIVNCLTSTEYVETTLSNEQFTETSIEIVSSTGTSTSLSSPMMSTSSTTTTTTVSTTAGNVQNSTINEKILFHLKIVFLCRKPKQNIQKGLLGSYFLGTTV